jgi:uncharacterized protein DUF6249
MVRLETEVDMEAGILVPISLFLMVLGIVWISVNASMQKRKATLRVVEEAIRAGQTMTPDTIQALGMPNKNHNADLKSGLVLIAVAAAFVVLGLMLGSTDEDGEITRIMAAVASFPGFIGLVLVGFGLMGRKKDADA